MIQFNEFMAIGNGFINDYRENQEKFKQRTIDDWKKTYKMPRKMKKRIRKSLELDWQIANYKPFGGLF